MYLPMLEIISKLFKLRLFSLCSRRIFMILSTKGYQWEIPILKESMCKDMILNPYIILLVMGWEQVGVN